MLLKICILIVCSIYSAYAQSVQIEPSEAVFSMVPGSSLQVNCTSPNSVEWSADPTSAMPKNAVKARAVPEDKNFSTLMLVNISKANVGTFRCKDKETNDEMSFNLKVFSVSSHNATFEYKVDTVLECSVDEDDQQGLSFTYSWRKGDVPVEDITVEGKQAFVSHPNGTLEIRHPARRFAGMYTCTAEATKDNVPYTINVDVPYYATPKVLPFDKSKNLVQDEKLVVECQVLGYPKPSITWMKGSQVIDPTKESRYKLFAADTYDEQSMENARLEIESVDFDDAGEYRCIANHSQWPGFNSSQPILVRVKDKLAALWPFLGIMAEVVILCIIIFVYEKKRNKDAILDEEDDQDRTATEKKSENVRHRGNTNNPRA